MLYAQLGIFPHLLASLITFALKIVLSVGLPQFVVPFGGTQPTVLLQQKEINVAGNNPPLIRKLARPDTQYKSFLCYFCGGEESGFSKEIILSTLVEQLG